MPPTCRRPPAARWSPGGSAPSPVPAAADLAEAAQAAEHGAASLASLGLPRLVNTDFVSLDPTVIKAAVDDAMKLLDATDGDPEAEPWLGWTAAGVIGAHHDAERDTADAELDLGWPANRSQAHFRDNTPDGDPSALERLHPRRPRRRRGGLRRGRT